MSKPSSAPERRTSLTDQIAAELRRRILAGQLAEGTALRQTRLATELGVSRIPLREAMRQLEAEGFVVSELHKGTVVARLSPDEIEEMFGIRLQLEPWLLEQAIPRMTEADLDRAGSAIDAAIATGTSENWSELNWRFHEALYRPSGSRVALKMLRSLHDSATRYINCQLLLSLGNREYESIDHHAILAYARSRDVERGVAMLRRHISRVARDLVTALTGGAAAGGPSRKQGIGNAIHEHRPVR